MRERKRVWINPEVQGALVLRATLYWFECLLTVFFMTVCWTAWTEPVANSAELFSRVASRSLPVLAASVLVLPLVLFDMLRASHQFVGPLHRVRASLRALTSGHQPAPITFRETDYWKEFAEDVNNLMRYVHCLRSQNGTWGHTAESADAPNEPVACTSHEGTDFPG